MYTFPLCILCARDGRRVETSLSSPAAYDVVIQRYGYLVKHVQTITYIAPPGERTERGKMMVDTATKCYLHATYSLLVWLARPPTAFVVRTSGASKHFSVPVYFRIAYSSLGGNCCAHS